MAHMYTTKRGKNKKGKESVRKDQANNQERKLKTTIGDLTGFADKPKVPIGIIAGHLMGGGATGVSSTQTRIKDNPQAVLKALREKCSNPKCAKTSGELGVVLRDCSVCHAVKYCGRECQLHDWKEGGHGKVCKDLSLGKLPPTAGFAISEDSDIEDECLKSSKENTNTETASGLSSADIDL